MARKKIIFVIVEGPSDDTALGVILNRLYDKNEVYIEIYHGDITSERRISPENIVSTLGNLVMEYAAAMHFKQSDFQEVIHLIDMDGAFVPKSAIVENPEAKTAIYSLTEIQTKQPEDLWNGHLHKRSNINRICSLNKVWRTIPYRAYYMSCNLDHVLYDKLNSSDKEKENDAYAFSRKYKDDIDGFLTFISDSDFSRMEGYNNSWDFIMKDLHSLERNTNLGLCFAGIREERFSGKHDTK